MRDEYDEAIVEAERALSMAPGYAFGYITLVLAHDALGNESEVIKANAKLFRTVAGNPEAADFLETAYASSGYASANLQLAEMLVQMSESAHVPPMMIAAHFEQGGDYERAIDWLEIAVERFDPDAPYIGVNVKNPAMRSHQRLKALLRQMGLDYWAGEATKQQQETRHSVL